MAKVVICPSCQSKGSIPDEAQVARIRCPKCKEDVRRQGGDSVEIELRQGKSARPPAKRPQAAVTSAFDDLENVQPLPISQ